MRLPTCVKWEMSRDTFQGLLAAIDSDEERAAQQYERLRKKLIHYFAARCGPDGEERADETLDRIGRRLEQGEAIHDVTRYAYGVARLILKESLKRVSRRRRLLRIITCATTRSRVKSDPEPDCGPPLECLRYCGRQLPAPERTLIMRYYEGSGHEQFRQRQALAKFLGLSSAALRLRAHRIRRRLKACARECMAANARNGRVTDR
jgi:DNA-directed RNA polymerase specialized sigma24 family protein